MVTNTNISSSNYGSSSLGAFGRGGVIDWIIQRKTAVLAGLYFAYLFYFFCINNPLTYDIWLGLFKPVWLKVLHIIVLISILKHAWIGMWTIATDYIAGFKTRTIFLFIVKASLLIYLIWAAYIIIKV